MTDSLHVVCPQCDGINRIPIQRHLSKSDIPLLVDFWASWCGPCKIMAPVFAEAAGQLEPKLRLVKINSEQEQSLSGELGIRSIPTLILFKNGAESARMSGALDLPNLLGWVSKHIN